MQIAPIPKDENILNFWFGWLGAMAHPVPIPNTEVKHGSGDDTILGKVASRQNQAFNQFVAFLFSYVL